MGFRRIQVLAVLLPALSVGLFEYFRHRWLERLLPGVLGHLVGALVVASGVYGFVRIFISMIRRSALEVARAREEAAVTVERQRIAREMHDHVAQALFYTSVKLREVAALVEAGQRDQACRELQAILEGHLKDTYQRVRQVIADLRKQADREDFGAAVHRTATRVAGQLGLQVACTTEGRPALPAAAQQHLLAIIQEALTNAHRHGGARRATVRAHPVGRDLEVEVTDDGSGFDPAAVALDGRYGLTIMAERARMAGGELSLDAAPGRGTRVTVHVPGVMP